MLRKKGEQRRGWRPGSFFSSAECLLMYAELTGRSLITDEREALNQEAGMQDLPVRIHDGECEEGNHT